MKRTLATLPSHRSFCHGGLCAIGRREDRRQLGARHRAQDRGFHQGSRDERHARNRGRQDRPAEGQCRRKEVCRADDHRSYQNQHRAEGHGRRRDEGRNSDRLDDSSQKKLDKLRDAKPEDFAGEYDPMQVSAHKDAVSLFERYAKGGDDPKLKDWAGKTLPPCSTISRWRRT